MRTATRLTRMRVLTLPPPKKQKKPKIHPITKRRGSMCVQCRASQARVYYFRIGSSIGEAGVGKEETDLKKNMTPFFPHRHFREYP